MRYARDPCVCMSCSMSAKARVVATLAAPFVIVLAAPLWVPVVAVHLLRARACMRRFFGMLKIAGRGGHVIIRARRFLVVDVRPSRRDEPASALLLHLPHGDPDAAAPSKASASSAVDWPHHQGDAESLEPFLVHLTKERLEHAAFLDQFDVKWPRWSLWMDCAQPLPLPATATATIAALAAAAASSPHLPLFSNARTLALSHSTHSRTSTRRRLHCEADVDLFLVGRAPWLSALVLRYDIAARRIQRSWRRAVGDPSMQLCRRRLLGEARELNLFSRSKAGAEPRPWTEQKLDQNAGAS